MIKTQLLTPEVYYKESRDFQLFGRLYDSIFNYLKTEIDLIKTFPLNNNQDTSFVELLLKTLGFRNLREYQTDQLLALASIWVKTIKNKGSLQAIKDVVNLILRTENITNPAEIVLDTVNQEMPTVVIKIKDLISSQESSLLEEALNYILPIGTAYIIQDVSVLNSFIPMTINLEENTSLTEVEREDISSLAKGKDLVETNISGAQAHTGTFTDDYKEEDKMKQGSIRVGTLQKKKKKKE